MANADDNNTGGDAAAKLKSLELLFDYTKFHIGLYLTLAGSYITVANVWVGGSRVVPIKPLWMWVAMFAFMIAGLSGGIIASTITQAYGQPGNESAKSFLDKPTGPSSLKWFYFSGRTWTQVEHIAFWVGLISAVLSFLRGTSTTIL